MADDNLDDVLNDPDVREFLAAADRDLGPKVAASAIGLSILNGEVDPKIAIELGYILLMGKPLILVVMPGTVVPDGLVRAAEEIVEWSDDRDVMGNRINGAIARLKPEQGW